MNETEFIAKYQSSQDALKAWGDFVVRTIKEAVRKAVSAKSEYLADAFFKVPPKYRIKDLESLTEKAFRRGKNYSNPWADITDKVGCRFVVLLLQDIDVVKTVVEQSKAWDYSLDRDFEKEKSENPEYFSYQSVHYVVRNKTFRQHTFLDVSTGLAEEKTVSIPPEITCEIQIRTLLQHAFSELTHDAIYKSPVKAAPEVKRIVSRCSALIETTDNMFKDTQNSIEKVSSLFQMVEPCCLDFLRSIGKIVTPSSTDTLFTKMFLELLGRREPAEFFSYLDEYSSVIAERIAEDERLAQPHQLLFMFLAERCRSEFEAIVHAENIPFGDIEPVYVRLGFGRPNWL